MTLKSLKLCQALALAGVMSAAVAAPAAGSRTYLVQLAGAPTATYNGGVAGLAATQAAEGQRLDVRQAAVKAHRDHLQQEQRAVLGSLGTQVRTLHHFTLTFNGFSAVLTDAQARKLKAHSKVLAVLPDERRDAVTVSTPHFLGLDVPGGVWSRKTHGSLDKGEGVIVAVIDSGVQPEDPSFFDRVDANGVPVKSGGTLAYGPAPAKWAGSCASGPGFPADACNNKLIGAKVFSAGFKAAGATPDFRTFLDVPRDENGHGSHTLSTAGGNANTPAYSSSGTLIGSMSGIAPRARVASYKALFQLPTGTASGYNSDLVAAIDAAVADGVDVINYSVSGAQTDLLDPVEVAFFGASAAGVFVAASAGNSGPGNQVAHPSPWVTTVAASTHDRQMVAKLTLGNASSFVGSSFNTAALPSASMVLSSDIAAPGVPNSNANLCFLNSLDPAKAAGKIVVCDRGTNARVEKSAEVKRVGGVGMVLINPTASTLVADFHSVPTVHLQNTERTAVRGYVTAQGSGASGDIGVAYSAPGAIAPTMASFSSRGPNLAESTVLKPEITAPGVDVIASYAYIQGSQAEHDAILAGTLVPNPVAESLQGTSMSSPHVAGAAALVKQAHPTWSPAMIKSALLTSTTGVKAADGSNDPDRYGYGAGHLNPTGAVDPGLVYPATPADYLKFLCGAEWLAADSGTCTGLGSITPTDLNLPTFAVEVPGTVTVKRRVRNVTNGSATFTGSASVPGVDVSFSPPTLALAKGEVGQYTATFKTNGAAVGSTVFGSLSWTDGSHVVTSPVQARPTDLGTPRLLSSSDATGSRKFKVTYGFEGSTSAVVTGLKAATRSPGTVVTGATQCFVLAVPADALVVRAALYNADTSGNGADDLDLSLYNPSGTQVAISGGATANELVSANAPVAGNWQACVAGYAPNGGSSNFTLSSWVLSSSDTGGSLKTKGLPTNVAVGDVATVKASWADLVAGTRYLGGIRFAKAGGAVVGQTLLSVEPGAAQLTQRDAEIAPAKLKALRAR